VAKLTAILEKYEGQPGSLIPILQELQALKGYLPAEDLVKVSRGTSVPLSEIYAVATFYSQFYLEKRGRHIVRVCRGTACHVKGGHAVLKAVEHELGVGDGETTEDYSFTLETVACLGACFLAPVIVVDGDYFGRLTPDKAASILRNMK
jgi:NADH-quinone oxidoreductase subunit E